MGSDPGGDENYWNISDKIFGNNKEKETFWPSI